PTAGGDVRDEAALHPRVEVRAGRQRDHRTHPPGIVALQVDRAEPVAGHQQGPGQRLTGATATVGDQVLAHVPHDFAGRVVVLGHVRVRYETQDQVVVLLVHAGQPRLLGAHGRDGPRRRGVGQPALALRSDGRADAVPLAGDGDAVVAVADRLVQRPVDAPGEEVVVD